MFKNKKVLAHIAILGANIIYGINYTIAKPIMPNYVGPLGLAVVRVLSVIVMFWLLGLIYPQKVDKKDWVRLLICGVFGAGLNQLVFMFGLNYTTPIDASIILTSNPILVMIFAAFILRERISALRIAGIAFAALGAVILIAQGGKASFGGEHFIGNMFILLNAAFYAIYLVMVKPLMAKYHPITVLKWIFLIGIFIVGPVGFSEFNAIDWGNMPTKIIWSLVFVVLGTTFLTYLFNIYGMKHVSPTVVSSYIYSQPVVASITAILLSQDSISFVKILSTGFVFVGVYLVSLPPSSIKFSFLKGNKIGK